MWISGIRSANLRGHLATPRGSRSVMRRVRARSLLLLLAAVAAGPCWPRGSGSRRRTTARSAKRRHATSGSHRTCRCPAAADLKDKKIMVVIGERQIERLHRGAAAELRPALPGDQQAPAGARPAHVHARGDPPTDRAGGDRRVFPQRSRRRARGLAAARRELRAARPDLVAGDAQSDDGREPGIGEHGVHAHRQQRPRDFRCRRDARAPTPAPTSQRMALTLVNEKADEVVARLYADYCRNAGPTRMHGTARRSRPHRLIASGYPRRHRHEAAHSGSPGSLLCSPRPLALAASLALAQPRFGNPSPTAGSDTSQQANESADQALYKPVEYTNASKKGPALIVIPGEIKSSNATFLQKFTPNNIADFGEVELSARQFPGARARRISVRSCNEFELAYNLGDPQQARKFLGMGKLKTTKYVVKFDILKTEQVASAQQGFDGRALGQMAGMLRRVQRLARRRAPPARSARPRVGSVQTGESTGVWIIGMRYKIINAETTEQLAQGYTEEKMEVGAKSIVGARRVAVAAGRRVARHDGAAPRAEIGVGNRQQVQVACRVTRRRRRTPASPFRPTGRSDDREARQVRDPPRARPRRDGRRLRGLRPADQAPRRAEDDPPRPARGRAHARTCIARFRREAQAAGRLTHPNIVVDLRFRRGRRHVVHRDGVRRRTRAQGVLRGRRALSHAATSSAS